MSGALAVIYSETLIAQVAMMRIADTLPTIPQDIALWNEVEESLEAALDRFRAYRAQLRLQMPPNASPPGFAGATIARLADDRRITPYPGTLS